MARKPVHAGEMLPLLKRHEIQVLLRAGHAQRDVAARTGTALNTVRRVKHEGDVTETDDAAFAGLRAGEVRGLRWPDVDLRRGVITVRRSVVGGVEGSPKSGHGRVVPIAAPLRPHLEAAAKSRKSPWSEVALTSYGKPWKDGGLTQAFERARDRAGLSGWTFHSLRHFFITELCRRGAPTMVVKQLAGHSELGTTQRYAHMVDGDLGKAIGLFG